MAGLIQDDLKQVGMRVNVSPAEFNSIVTRLDSTHDWECVLIGFTAGVLNVMRQAGVASGGIPDSSIERRKD